MQSIKQRMNKNEDEGFTLIELMVVVLILGILMAIAIPTFLSLTSSAKTNAAESDLTTAAQDEAVYFTTNGSYDNVAPGTPTAANNIGGSTATTPGMTLTDPGINWTATAASLTAASAGTKLVLVTLNSGTNIVLGTAGSNGSFYWISDTSGALTYARTTSATVPAATAITSTSWKAVG